MNQDSNAHNDELIPEHRFKNGVRGKYTQRKGGEPSKVRVTMDLDLDVYNYFQERAAAPQAASYQTQINAELRQVMEADRQVTRDYAALLNDEDFIAAVAARVKETKLP
jgi:uncharacterized protein (DUF4415 family)